MQRHEQEQEQVDPAAVRPKGSRPEEHAETRLWQAGADGRADVVGPAGMLRLQRVVGNRGVAGLAEEERSPVLDVLSSGGGRPLDPPVQADMESRLGADFDDVRVHTDDAAHRSAAAVDAHAYTVGSDVVFRHGAYDPSSTAGRTTLAHELTHVVQQRSGPVDGTPTGDGVRVSDPSDRFEREAAANADRAMAAPAVGTAVAGAAASSSSVGAAGPGVQRAADDVEEEEPVQRAASPDAAEEQLTEEPA